MVEGNDGQIHQNFGSAQVSNIKSLSDLWSKNNLLLSQGARSISSPQQRYGSEASQGSPTLSNQTSLEPSSQFYGQDRQQSSLDSNKPSEPPAQAINSIPRGPDTTAKDRQSEGPSVSEPPATSAPAHQPGKSRASESSVTPAEAFQPTRPSASISTQAGASARQPVGPDETAEALQSVSPSRSEPTATFASTLQPGKSRASESSVTPAPALQESSQKQSASRPELLEPSGGRAPPLRKSKSLNNLDNNNFQINRKVDNDIQRRVDQLNKTRSLPNGLDKETEAVVSSLSDNGPKKSSPGKPPARSPGAERSI